MISNCMLHNERECSKREAIDQYRSLNKVLIVNGFDWNTITDNPALLYEFINRIARDISGRYSVPIEFEGLGGREGSIYCDICEQIQKAEIALFDVSTSNPNVVFELGLAISSGAYVYILRSKHAKQPRKLVSDLNGVLEYRFTRRAGNLVFESDFKASLTQKLVKVIDEKAAKQATE